MPEEHDEYGGKEYTYDENEENPKLTIDDEEVSLVYEEGGYYTTFLPYENYSSLEDLAEDIIDHWDELESSIRREQEREDG